MMHPEESSTAAPPADATGRHGAGEKLARYQMICELGQMVTSEVNLEALFDLIIRQTTRIMGCEKASVFLFDPRHDQLWAWVSTDLRRNSIRISKSCGVAGWVFGSKTALILNDPYNDPRFFPGVDIRTGFRTRSILCIPLLNRQQQAVGTLQALNKNSGGFTEEDRELLTAASYYMTIALENAKLYEELKELDRARERVIHHLSHEIRTPLSILAGVISRLKKALNAADPNTDLERTLLRGERNLERLVTIQRKIDDIICGREGPAEDAPDLHQLAQRLLSEVVDEAADTSPELVRRLADRLAAVTRRRRIARERVKVGLLLQSVCDTAEAAIRGRELCLMRHFDGEAELCTDGGVLASMCEGLLKNAIENTPDEGIVEVSSEMAGDDIRITVTDHGVGITPANQNLIFSGFFHTQPTEHYASKKPYQFNAGGAGADLLRIKSFAARLGFHIGFSSRRCPFLPRDEDSCPGRISACSFIRAPGECHANSGSTFTLRLPAGAAGGSSAGA
jgi:signal transduction histidine kinase